jgi:diadenosine tetraphosphate (Ap4A) HIT family hydrolase
MKNDCLFCENEQINGKTIHETENFRVRVGLGLITPGHCMILSKYHYPCMAAIPPKLVDGYLKLKNKLEEILTEKFAEPFITEYGAVFQSIFHAHKHFIPAESEAYKKVNILKDQIIPITQKHNLKFEEVDFKQLQEIYKVEKEYVYYEQYGKGYVIHTKGTDHKVLYHEISYRGYFQNVVKLKGIGNWRTLTEEERIIDKKKQNQTLEAFKNVKWD